MIQILKSEFYKIKHTWIYWFHIILPVAYAITFYYTSKVTSLRNFEVSSIIQNYLVFLGAVLPIIIGVITSKIIDMEVSAGHFQVLLSSIKSKSKVYSGKLFTLLIGALCSISIAIVIFGLLFGHQLVIAWLIEIWLIFIGCVSIYMIHLWVSIIFGGGASIGLGFLETLIAFLLMTSLGEKMWYFLPCTWSSRLPATYIVGTQLTDGSFLYHELTMWIYIAIPMTILIFISSLIWFNKWDGKTT
ncbi:MAG: lantibiotic immunity ABC transporter MutG family permease subunit [Streptococcus sp.]|nr:lantibiotic immunity ABC transporter MutG family permease subunit [Streptococcus sp.]